MGQPKEVNFLYTIFEWVSDFLQSIMGMALAVFNWLPEGWPSWLKAVLIFAAIVIAGRIFFSLVELLSASPVTIFERLKLLFFSPYGKAKWAHWGNLYFSGLTKRGGLFLGQWRKLFFWRQDIFHHGEGHFITISAPGGGKTSAALIPTLLESTSGSFIVTDPKGEVTAITRRHRESVSRVIYLNPYFEDFEKQTGLEYPDSGFNPFDFIENSRNTRAQADNFARFLCVTDRSGSDSYFKDEGAVLLSLYIAWIVRHEPEENCNLAYLYELVRSHPRQIFQYIDYANDPLLKADADKFRNMYKNAPAQWEGVISKAQLATARYIPTTPLAVHTSKSSFDPQLLKQEDVTVYILLPTEHIETGAPWLNLIIGLLGKSVGKAGKARPVTFLMDELPALGYLPDLITQMRQYRSSGLRMWLFSQTTAALADRDMYGHDGLKDLFGLCDTKQFFSIQHFETASEISQMCGEKSSPQRNLNPQENIGMSVVGVPLIRPEDILKLRKWQQIILHKNVRPIKARLVPYFKRRKWRKMTDPNPYL